MLNRVIKLSGIFLIVAPILILSCGDEIPVEPDVTPPSILSTIPADGANDVLVMDSISVVLSEQIDSASVDRTTFHFSVRTYGDVSCQGNVIRFAPTQPLQYNKTYEVTVDSTVADMSANTLAGDYSWNFTTEYHSSTGVVWTVREIPNSFALDYHQLTVAPGMYIACSNSGIVPFLFSYSGVYWEWGDVGLEYCYWFDSAFFGYGHYSFPYGSVGVVYVSHDAESWSRVSDGPVPVLWCAAKSDAIYVGQPVGGGPIQSSNDGIVWEAGQDLENFQAHDIVWTGERFIMVGYNDSSSVGHVYTSNDGLEWTSRHSCPGVAIEDIAISESQILCVGSSGMTFLSGDGLSWTERATGRNVDLHGITWSDGQEQFIAVGASGTIIASPDGLTWTNMIYEGDEDVIDVEWIDHKYIAVGLGMILTSP